MKNPQNIPDQLEYKRKEFKCIKDHDKAGHQRAKWYIPFGKGNEGSGNDTANQQDQWQPIDDQGNIFQWGLEYITVLRIEIHR